MTTSLASLEVKSEKFEDRDSTLGKSIAYSGIGSYLCTVIDKRHYPTLTYHRERI